MTTPEDHGPTMVDVILPLERSEDESFQKKAVARKLKIPPARIKELRLRKHSIDARRKDIKIQLRFEVGVDAELLPEAGQDDPAHQAHGGRNTANVCPQTCAGGRFAGGRCAGGDFPAAHPAERWLVRGPLVGHVSGRRGDGRVIE